MRYARPYTLIRRGEVWYYLLHGEKTRHSTGQASKRKAGEYVDKMLGAPTGGRTTLDAFATGFFLPGSDYLARQEGKARRMSPSTAHGRQAQLEQWILPALGRLPLAEITPVAIERWLAGIHRSNQTRNHILITLRLVLRDARRSGLITHNPADDVESMGLVFRHRDALAIEELALLFPPDRANLVRVWGSGRQAVAYTLMATTGMRVGEVVALRWEHIRWDIPAVLIVQAVKREGVIGPPKNGRPRSALIPSRTVELLRWWKGEAAYDDYVVHGLHGGPGNPGALAKAWKIATVRAGIVPGGRFLGAHALRHTFETRYRGLIPDEVLRYMLGHQSPAMSERYDQATPAERAMRIVSSKGALESLWQ